MSQSGTQTLTGTCQSGGNPSYPQCTSGEVTFTGTGYGPQAHVKVRNSAGVTIDNSIYNTTSGNVTFTENFSFADTYTVQIGNDDYTYQSYTVTTY